MIRSNRATMPAAYVAMSWRTPASKLPFAFQIGQFVTLPSFPSTSIVNSQRHITKTACNHPLVIVGMKHNGTTVTLTVLQVTSFGGMLIEEKYHDQSPASRARKASYLAIDHAHTRSHTEYTPLKLVSNAKMDKQSYINLDQFFTVEADHIAPWKNGRHGLDSESITTLEKAFVDFFNGVTKRPEKTNESVDSPFEYWSQECLTASYLGVNDCRFVRPPPVNQAVNTVGPPSLSPATPRSRKAIRAVHPAFKGQDWRAKTVRIPS